MPDIQPTIVIGLGTTGLHILEYLQQFVMEEFGTTDIPIIQLLAFETKKNARSSRSIRTVPLTVPKIGRVAKYIENNPTDPKVKGYKNWLPPKLLDFGDSFEDGANGVRAAGRLILWENWPKVQQEIEQAYERCTNRHNVTKTNNMLKKHYGDDAENQGSSVLSAPQIFVVGTLCGGSCSGMFIDLGYLLSNLYGTDVRRILTVTMPSNSEATVKKNENVAANTFAALYELDFCYHRLPEGSWEYGLADGKSKAKVNETPYKLVYLVSSKNGRSTLASSGLNQMIAMNLFLDLVGPGREKKDEAIADYELFMAERICDNGGYVRYFFSFGLSTVWYPKLKITGSAACDLAKDLCESWLRKPQDIEILNEELAEDAEKDFKALRSEIAEAISQPINSQQEKLTSIDRNRLARDPNSRLEDVVDAHLSTEILKAVDSVDQNIIGIVASARARIHAQLADRLYERYTNTVKIGAYWENYKAFIEAEIEKSPEPPNLPPSMKSLAGLRRGESGVKNDIWVRLVRMRRQALESYRRRYLKASMELWGRSLRNVKFSRWKQVLRMLRMSSDDQEVLKSQLLGGSREQAAHLTSLFRDEDELLGTFAGHLSDILKKVKTQEEKFDELGGSKVVHEVFTVNDKDGEGSVEDDVSNNRKTIERENPTPPATSVKWHLTKDRSDTGIDTTPKFWQQDSTEIANRLVSNYQKEGLAHLPARQVQADAGELGQLADFAEPYMEFGDLKEDIDIHRGKGFVFGRTERQGPDEIAETVGFEDDYGSPSSNTGLRHMLFLYKEERCFAIDYLAAFKPCEQAANDTGRSHYTHVDKNFYNWRRIADHQRIKYLIRGADKLLPDDSGVFQIVGGKKYFRYEAAGKSFDPDSPDQLADMANTDGCTRALELKVKSYLDGAMTKDEFHALFTNMMNSLEDKRIESVSTSQTEQAAEIQKEKDLLEKFKEEIVDPILGSD